MNVIPFPVIPRDQALAKTYRAECGLLWHMRADEDRVISDFEAMRQSQAWATIYDLGVKLGNAELKNLAERQGEELAAAIDAARKWRLGR